uniref:Poly(A) polymerase catalytic subunit domain-containing protein n=1 Tax=viral metagenome TaxID=1070528 RepID=A0A6C0AJI1_9ZZZZ
MSELESIKAVADEQLQMLAARDAKLPSVLASTRIVEAFLKAHRVMCYGGTAINNLLPKADQFYGSDEVPDYDFFTETPQEHGVLLADQLSAAGIESVEVKPGVHLGTYKVFADYHGVADLTFIDPKIFNHLWGEKITRHGIHYVPPDFLRMSMYLELSRPEGDVSRWEKVYTRLTLLNKHYPIVCRKVPSEIAKLDAQRKADTIKMLKDNPVVLLGFSAVSRHEKKAVWYTPVTLLAEKETIEKLTKGEKTDTHEATEILPARTNVLDSEGEVVYTFYETQACHSYHTTGDGIKIGSIPTLLTFFMAMMYSDESKDDVSRLICVAQRLVELADDKPQRRYALLTPKTCLGTQKELLDLRRERVELYDKMKKNKTSSDFVQYFFTYNPKSDKTERAKTRRLLKKTRKARLTGTSE